MDSYCVWSNVSVRCAPADASGDRGRTPSFSLSPHHPNTLSPNTHDPVVLYIPCGAACDLVAVQAADDVERHVDAGGDPGGGDDLAFVDDARVVQDIGHRQTRAQPVDRRPVRRGA